MNERKKVNSLCWFLFGDLQYVYLVSQLIDEGNERNERNENEKKLRIRT